MQRCVGATTPMVEFDVTIEKVEELIRSHVQATEKLAQLHAVLVTQQQVHLYGVPSFPVISSEVLRKLRSAVKIGRERGSKTVLFNGHTLTLPYAELVLTGYET